MQYILDTHSLIWYLEGNPRLGAKAKEIISHPTSKMIFPAIALAESLWIISRSKTSIPSPMVLLQVLKADPRLSVYPLDLDILECTIGLTEINEMHDRQIVATALVIERKGEPVALITCDRNITDSKLLEIIWE
jgi:PIN domain nuclease of toxin-antitoxin system